MFESVSAPRSSSPGRKVAGVAVAAAAHGGVLALALFLGRPVPVTVAEPERQVLVLAPRPITAKPGERPPERPQGQRPKPPKRPLLQPTHEKELPPPESPAATPDTPPAVDPGAPDGPATPAGPGPGELGSGGPSVCPEGQTCTSGPSRTVEVIEGITSEMEKPRPHCVPPAPLPPSAASQFGLEGSVTALFVVHADGRVSNVRVLNADAQPIFAQAVRDWLESCEFTPARYQGSTVAVRMTQTFRFKSR